MSERPGGHFTHSRGVRSDGLLGQRKQGAHETADHSLSRLMILICLNEREAGVWHIRS